MARRYYGALPVPHVADHEGDEAGDDRFRAEVQPSEPERDPTDPFVGLHPSEGGVHSSILLVPLGAPARGLELGA